MGSKTSIPVSTGQQDAVISGLKILVNDSQSKMQKEMLEGGDYHRYRKLRMQRDIVCRHPLIYYSKGLRDDCFDLQMRTLQAQMTALNMTDGVSLLVDLFEK